MYSWIWLFLRPSAGSLIGNLMARSGDATTVLRRAENSVEMSLSS